MRLAPDSTEGPRKDNTKAIPPLVPGELLRRKEVLFRLRINGRGLQSLIKAGLQPMTLTGRQQYFWSTDVIRTVFTMAGRKIPKEVKE